MKAAKPRKPSKAPDRAELVRQEMSKAAEFGLAPRAPLSLAENFRVSRSSAVAARPGSMAFPSSEVIARNNRDFQIGLMAPMVEGRFAKLPSGLLADPKGLEEAAAAEIEKLSAHTLGQVLPRVLMQLDAAAVQRKDARRVHLLRRRLSEKIFGKGRPGGTAGKTGAGRPAKS